MVINPYTCSLLKWPRITLFLNSVTIHHDSAAIRHLADVCKRVEIVNPSTSRCLSEDADGVRRHELVA